MGKISIFGLSAFVALTISVHADADLSDLTHKTVVFENTVTKRDLFSDGSTVTKPGAEGGWTAAPKILGTDSNYYNRANWQIIPSGEGYIIENVTTKRDLFSDGSTVATPGSEGGWTNSPAVVGADSNYYNRAIWKITASGDGYLIQNVFTKRYLLSVGSTVSGTRGAEGGWTASPKVVGADSNYYNRAVWKISSP